MCTCIIKGHPRTHPRTYLVHILCTLSVEEESSNVLAPCLVLLKEGGGGVLGGDERYQEEKTSGVFDHLRSSVCLTARLIAERDVTIIGKARPSLSTSTMSTVEFPALKPTSSDRLYSLILGLDNNCTDDIRLVIQVVH